MIVLRCTQKLLARLKKTGDLPPAESTTRIGDAYGNVFRLGPQQFVMFITEHSRLAVVVHARESKHLAEVLPDAIAELLAEIGVPLSDIEDERLRMREVAFGRTRSRSLLGTMNDYIWMAQSGYMRRGVTESPCELMRFLAQTPIVPLDGENPINLTRRAFGLPPMPRAYWRSR